MTAPFYFIFYTVFFLKIITESKGIYLLLRGMLSLYYNADKKNV